ncbi:protein DETOXIFICATION 45, chloroplastic-like isoform X2 [Fagus crenata]
MSATRVSKGIISKPTRPLSSSRPSQVRNSFVPIDRKRLNNAEIVDSCHLSSRNRAYLSPLVTWRRKPGFCLSGSQLSSDCDVGSSDVEEEEALSSAGEDTLKLTGTLASRSQSQDVKHELLMLSLPAIGGQALEPLTQLMETAYIGRLGERKQLSSVSTALLLAVGIGIIEALALYLGSGKFLDLMGVSLDSSMRIPAQQFLSLRALGAPAVVVSLALQGVFRGFKDTKTPVLCLGKCFVSMSVVILTDSIGNLSAIFLIPILMYYFQLGAIGAAISTVVSQYIVTFLLIWHLNKRAVLWPPKLGSLQFGGYIKSGGFLLGRTLAVLTTMTLGTSMAARQGPVAMAAHQICIQVWMAVSLLTDALAASAQSPRILLFGLTCIQVRVFVDFQIVIYLYAMVATSLSKGDYQNVRDITDYVLKIGLFTGVILSAILGVSFGSLATLFTKDAEVLGIVKTGVLFVSASQPLNALAYIFDGLHYGISDFPYAAGSMMLVGAICSAFLLYAPSIMGLPGVWLGLTLFMGLRTVAGSVRSGRGAEIDSVNIDILFSNIKNDYYQKVVHGGSCTGTSRELRLEDIHNSDYGL